MTRLCLIMMFLNILLKRTKGNYTVVAAQANCKNSSEICTREDGLGLHHHRRAAGCKHLDV